ncbi:rhomboid family intramembrane serine protease [Lysobacter panacisoli]|uniref:Rhomboid family intramembrane serine protease n=1 Tax=Lysobacter panacisoli TaxID=1255263 RepID=A0ABP9LP05_9GAMM|nr:rhomboid family intramembrane serine protease [Lysobacter panacisoli]
MFSNLPPITKALLIANGLVFVLQLPFVIGDDALAYFMLWPPGSGSQVYGIEFMPWQLVTYAFMHGNFAHLLFNMLALAMFGAPLEHVWGDRRYLTYYFVCVVGAALCQIGVGMWTMSQGGEAYPTVGASGGIFGLLLAYGLLFPNQRVMLLIPPIPMKARTLVLVYGAIELLLGISNVMPGVAHFAHLGGMLFGWLLIRYWRGQPPFGGRKPPRMRVVK